MSTRLFFFFFQRTPTTATINQCNSRVFKGALVIRTSWIPNAYLYVNVFLCISPFSCLLENKIVHIGNVFIFIFVGIRSIADDLFGLDSPLRDIIILCGTFCPKITNYTSQDSFNLI